MSKFYRYTAPGNFCVLEIRPNKEVSSKFDLYGDGEFVGSFDSPEDAAYAVSIRESGYGVWDQLKREPSTPNNLGDWTMLQD